MPDSSEGELNSLSQNLTVLPAPSKREPLACRKLCTLAGNFSVLPKAPSQRTTSPGRGKMSRSDKKGNLSSAARLGEFAPGAPRERQLFPVWKTAIFPAFFTQKNGNGPVLKTWGQPFQIGEK